MNEDEEKYLIVWGDDRFLGGIGLFFLLIAGALITVIIPIAGAVIEFLCIAAPIVYIGINVFGFVIPGLMGYGINFIFPVLIRLMKSGLLAYYVIYGALKSIEIPNVEEISGLFSTLGTGIVFALDVLMHVGIIMIFLIVDYGELCLERHVSIGDSLVAVHITCVISTIIFFLVFNQFVW